MIKIQKNLIDDIKKINEFEISSTITYNAFLNLNIICEIIEAKLKPEIESLKEIKISGISNEILTKNHPLLGDLTNDKHIFNTKSLFKNIKFHMLEPNYTKTLGAFLQKEKNVCKIFIETILEHIKTYKYIQKNLPEAPLQETTIKSLYEVPVPVDDKRIDNIILWKSEKSLNGIIIEAKLDAPLNNDLDAYTKYKIEGVNFIYIVLSIKSISPKYLIGKKVWINIQWNNLLYEFNKKIISENIEISEDFKRFLSALWHRILYVE